MGANGGGEYRFIIPALPPSVNALHNVLWSQRRVELKPEVRRFRSDVKGFVPRMVLATDSLLCVDLTFYYRHHYSNGKLRRLDTHNCVKVILDAIAEKLGIDDCRMKFGSWASVDSGEDKVEVAVREVKG